MDKLIELRKDAATLRASFMRNKAIIVRALRKAELPDSFLEGWQEKLDRMAGVGKSVGSQGEGSA